MEEISGRENFRKNEDERGCSTTASSALSTTAESAKANVGVAELADTQTNPNPEASKIPDDHLRKEEIQRRSASEVEGEAEEEDD